MLEGAETRISYDTTTMSGGPQLTYEGPYGTHSFDGDALTTEETALGRLVTGYLGAFPDQGDLWLTLLLPRFNPMTIDDGPAPFTTLAILKWLVSTIVGPPLEGALEEYQVLMLEEWPSSSRPDPAYVAASWRSGRVRDGRRLA